MFKGYSTVSKIDKKLSIIDKCFNIDKLRKIKKHASPNLNDVYATNCAGYLNGMLFCSPSS